MNPLLKRLLRMSEEHNLPVIIYDTKNDRAGVLMSLDYFDERFTSEALEDNDFEPLSGVYEDEECDEEDCDEFHDNISRTVNFLDDLQELEEKITEKIDEAKSEEELDEIAQSNEELALWKAKREEKEREEIEKTLEEELQENPPPDPFEEDLLHTAEWHDAGENLPAGVNESEPPKEEPSYHPVASASGPLSWTDWTFTGNSFTPIVQKNEDAIAPEEGGEDPIFLEEPV